ncbi:unnamed protein product [Closterium sp. Naga37s-1]|nr:unnamed protein product [Closterium sp. Naga37s-1]
MSPRALRVVRRGEASQLHEQQQEELVGREGIAAPGEVAEEQETAGGEVAAAAAAVENGATATEPEAAVAVEAADAAGPEVVAAEATGAAVAVERGGPDAAFGSGSASPSAIPQALQPEVLGPAVALEQTEEAELAVSPEPVTAAVLEAVVTAAVGEQYGDQAEEDEPTAGMSAETSAAAEGASTQGHGQEGSDRRGHRPGVAACAARGKAGKKKLRAQPAPRRPGAGLGPGPPGPLLGWLLQGQLPRAQGRQLPSAGTSGGGIEAENDIRQATTVNNNSPAAAAVDTAVQQTPRRETRSTTRAQGITWGQPRGHQAVPANTPWIPAGRAPQAGRGGRNAENLGRGGATAGMGRVGARGARGGRRGGGAIVGGREALLRSGTWRERHDRPEQVADPTTQNEADAERGEDGEDYEASASMPSEEISLEEEGEGTTRGERRRQEERRNPREERVNEEAPNEGQSDPGARSPSDLADDSSIWEMAATWDKYPLQKGDQPFVVRRMPPKILESYTLCLLAPLIRLSKNPDCPGAWAILQYLPRLTLRPAPEPVEGSRWTAIELRLHQFQLGTWQPLYTDACVIPDNESPVRHQPDDAGLCARAEGLIRKGNISKAVAALRTTPLAEATAATLTALQAKHPAAETSLPGLVTGFNRSTLSVSTDELREILKKCPNGVGAGPSGTCFEHLKDLALANGEVLILLAKTVTYLLSTFQTQSTRDLLLPSRSLLRDDDTRVALQLDIENAFNSVERAAFFNALS